MASTLPTQFTTPAPATDAAATAPAPAPAEEVPDAELLEQPLGYWTGVAGTAIVGHINAALGREGIAQPHWWSLNRIHQAPRGLTRREVADIIAEGRPQLDVSVVGPALEELLARDWVGEDDGGRLRLTAAGSAALDRLWSDVMPATLAQIRAGVSDAEYVTVVRVLRRVVRNLGGDDGFRL
ncbi:hypothetical protein V1J52_09155 [Streptomyces sp. TRM 70351]|uniref:hypothetical protein n=1 Tax=Streptomyces sp. TRM 70351 TaxID=3116552 RepID=UPI002E7B9161|nr:hypothetical protein [Streptomyces sp. TRM 70351]MEE1928360.1 hypothetical protein [Streptomyces sp. TRM 70351]